MKMLVKAAFSHQLVNEQQPLVAVTPADELDDVPVPQLCQDSQFCLKLLPPLPLPGGICRQHLDGHMAVRTPQEAPVHWAKPSLPKLVGVAEIVGGSRQLTVLEWPRSWYSAGLKLD